MIAHSYPLLDSRERSLLARNRSHGTIASYRNDCTKLADHLGGKDFAVATKRTSKVSLPQSGREARHQ